MSLRRRNCIIETVAWALNLALSVYTGYVSGIGYGVIVYAVIGYCIAQISAGFVDADWEDYQLTEAANERFELIRKNRDEDGGN